MKQRIACLSLLLTLLVCVACNREEHAADTDTATATASGDTGATTETTLTSPAGTPAPATASTLSPGDQEFARKAAKTGMAEVQLATNVTQRASSEEVRSFAQKMIQEHNASNQELTMLAASKQLDPPSDIDPEKKALDAELAKLTGAALDKAYMEAMVKDHATAAADFEKASQQLTDPDLKAWAAKTLPVLHQHHALAEQIVAKLK